MVIKRFLETRRLNKFIRKRHQSFNKVFERVAARDGLTCISPAGGILTVSQFGEKVFFGNGWLPLPPPANRTRVVDRTADIDLPRYLSGLPYE